MAYVFFSLSINGREDGRKKHKLFKFQRIVFPAFYINCHRSFLSTKETFSLKYVFEPYMLNRDNPLCGRHRSGKQGIPERNENDHINLFYSYSLPTTSNSAMVALCLL